MINERRTLMGKTTSAFLAFFSAFQTLSLQPLTASSVSSSEIWISFRAEIWEKENQTIFNPILNLS
jgi:hypothetical protein